MSADTVASEFYCWADNEEVAFRHRICNYEAAFPDYTNLQTILTALFDHARECEKERNPKPKKRKPPHGAW